MEKEHNPEGEKKRSVSKKVIYRSCSAAGKKPERRYTSQVLTLQTYQASYNASKIKLVTADSFVSAEVIHFKILS